MAWATAVTAFDAALAARPGRMAVIEDGSGRTASAVELLACRERLDGVLTRAGVPRGAPVALAAEPGFVSAAALLAVLGRNACLPVSPRAGADEVRFALADAGIAALVAVGGPPSPAALAAVADLGVMLVVCDPLDGDPDDVAVERPIDSGRGTVARPVDAVTDAQADAALLLHTSGTTARPKLVALRADQLLHVAHGVAGALDLGPADRGFVVMPLFHIHGIVAGVLAPLVSGGTVVVRPFDAFSFERMLSTQRCTWATAVPSMYQAVLARPRRVERERAPTASASLRLLRSSSAPLPEPVAAMAEERFGCPMLNSYGMTEAAHQMATQVVRGERVPGTVGRGAGAELAVLVDGHITDRPGLTGELVVRGRGVIDRYASGGSGHGKDGGTPGDGDHHVTEQAGPLAGRWFRTGDLGRIEPGGHVRVAGRLKEIINVAGEKVSPYEVEAVLATHPAVWACVAFPVADGLRGERVGALVVPRGDVPPDLERSIRDHARDRLAAHKVPARVLAVDALPLGPTGKLQRNRIAALLGLDEP